VAGVALALDYFQLANCEMPFEILVWCGATLDEDAFCYAFSASPSTVLALRGSLEPQKESGRRVGAREVV